MSPAQMPEADFQRMLEYAPGPHAELPSDLDFSFILAFVNSPDSHVKDLFRTRRCAPGEIIMQEGEPGSEIFIIRIGRIAIFKGPYDAPVILGYRGAGDMVGEMSVLENRPRSATVVALAECELLSTDQQGFAQMLSQPPFLGMNLLGMLSHRLRAIGEIHQADAQVSRQLSSQVELLESEKRHLLEMDRLRQETTDLIVHDLRNPLSSIMGSIKVLQLLLPKDISPESQELLQIALASSARMQRLVDSMLEVSRMQAGEIELVLKEVDLAELVPQVTETVLRPHGQEVQYRLELGPDLPLVKADRDRLERVLANLLDNAAKHSPSGGLITVEALRQENTVQVSVTDAGPGIPPEERTRIFERFAQVSGEKRKRRGFGLGLNFCKLTIEAHGGKIWIEPGPQDVGSRFVFTLPAP